MAKASARPKVAAFVSSVTSGGPGITTQEISDLRDMFRPGATHTSSRTSPSPTLLSFKPSTPPSRRLEAEPNNASERPATEISIKMPNGDQLHIQTDQKVTIEFNRDFTDVTRWTDTNRTYLVDKGTFTIKGKL
jgi:hypothetical protein